jgi:23S rRNA A2030 N6-methylase RlmJ
LRPRAQRASTTDSSHLSERSERSERSELCDGAARPSIAGQSTRSGDRLSEALRPARARLCRANMGMQERAAPSRQPPFATGWRGLRAPPPYVAQRGVILKLPSFAISISLFRKAAL